MRAPHTSQLEHVFSQTPSALLGQFLIIILMTLLTLRSGIPANSLYILAVCGAGLLLHRYLSFRSYYRDNNRTHNQQILKWSRTYIANALFMGVWWSAAFVQATQHAPEAFHYITMAIGLGLAGAAIVTLGAVFRIYCAFISPMLATLTATLFFKGTYVDTVLAWVVILGFAYLLYAANKFSQNFQLILDSNERLRASEFEALRCLSKLSEHWDPDADDHVVRVGYSSYVLAKSSGFSEDDARALMLASQLHDVGKIAVPESILRKPGSLSEEELSAIKEHCTVGAEILSAANSDLMKLAQVVALTHHEKWDGSGYPRGLSGEDIPIEGRIVAICDVYDALVSSRPYKDGWTTEAALDFLKENAGVQFDARLVALFTQEIPRINAFSSHLDDGIATTIHPLFHFPLPGVGTLKLEGV